MGKGVRPTKTNDQLEPTVFAISGGAGDLACRKLVPALLPICRITPGFVGFVALA
jgi:hypothetical protein